MTETKTVKLGELLNSKQLIEVGRILKSSADSIERVRRLKDYFGTFREDLEKKGVLPEYLAYVMEYLTVNNLRSVQDVEDYWQQFGNPFDGVGE